MMKRKEKNKMTELECKNCGNRDKFIVIYLYKYLVNSKGEGITTPEMDDLPEYECEKCGSTDIKITVLVQ